MVIPGSELVAHPILGGDAEGAAYLHTSAGDSGPKLPVGRRTRSHQEDLSRLQVETEVGGSD